MSSFISPTTPTETHSSCLKDGAGSGNGCVSEIASVSRTNSTQAYRAMEEAFIRWHVFGTFDTAAEYHKARQAWELALMDETAA